MPPASTSKVERRRSRRPKLAPRVIQQRLEQIEVATVSSLRALQMDIGGDEGIASADVMRRARQALR